MPLRMLSEEDKSNFKGLSKFKIIKKRKARNLSEKTNAIRKRTGGFTQKRNG